MEHAAGENDFVFRIGSDEFVMLTASEDEGHAGAIAREILVRNGECVDYKSRKIPLSLHCTVFRSGEKIVRYSELFIDLRTALRDVKT